MSRAASPSLDTYAGLDLDFERPGARFAPFTRAHAVGGVDWKLSTELSFLAEIGLALNGASAHYFSAGVALTLR